MGSDFHSSRRHNLSAAAIKQPGGEL